MSKTVTLSESTYAALCSYFSAPASSILSGTVLIECRRAFPAENPAILTGGAIPASLPGYTSVISQEWTFGTPFRRLQTHEHGGWDGKSVVIIGITVPVGASGGTTFTISEYPALQGQYGTERECCLAKSAGAFVTDIANGYVKGYNAGLKITVDGPKRAVAYLPPGRYFLNVKWADPSNARMQL